MGFGTLFIGYFLLLNIFYYQFTDVICAALMALALHKLSGVNKDFRYGFYSAIGFIAFGALELILGVMLMFNPSTALVPITPYVSMARYVTVFILTLFMLRGIKDVAGEVGLKNLSHRASVSVYFTAAVYALLFIFEMPALALLLPEKALAIISLCLLLSVFTLVIANLVTVYTAYMRICMPGDEDNDEQKPSKFAFVNRYRERKEEKEREYAEYQLEKMKKKAQQKKNKKKR